MKSFAATILVTLFFGAGVFAESLSLHPLFSNNMVLQREIKVPVWGWAKPGDQVTVGFSGQCLKTTADKDGRWKTELAEMKANESAQELNVSDGQEKIILKNVLVGDVWLCSGQSNMVYQFGPPPGFDTNYPMIREFTVPRSINVEKQETFKAPRVMEGHVFEKTNSWLPCTPTTAGKFSGVGLFAAIEMYKELKIPIGIINCSFNGSSAVLWIPPEILRKDSEYDWIFKEADEGLANYRRDIDQYEKDQSMFMRMKEEMDKSGDTVSDFNNIKDKGLEDGWMNPGYDAANWLKITWGWTNCPPIYIWNGDSVLWFRIPCARIKPDGDLKLLGGEFRNCVTSYFFNGKELHSSGKSNDGQDEFIIRRSEIEKDSGLLVIRAFCNKKMASIWKLPSSPDMLVLFHPQGIYNVAEYRESPDNPVKFCLAGHKYAPPGEARYPGSRFNAMLNPVIPYAIKGFIWYQGESECMLGIRHTKLYARTLPLLVKTWRDLWGGGDKPFVVVQLASYPYDPKQSSLMEMRESQKAVLALPNTAVSPSMDIREPGNVHPRNKYDIGTRAGRTALAIGYQKKIQFSGPSFKEMKIEGEKIRILFSNVGAGLAVGEKNGIEPVKFLSENNVPHFLIAGKDGKFVPANAKIDGDTVLVWSEEIKEPSAVRYAWTNMPENPLLYNKEGLPACSFRTDGVD